MAVTHDGNEHDRDDIGASAFSLATIWAWGIQDKLVHFDYNNHLGSSKKEKETQMEISVQGAVERFNFRKNMVFDLQKELSAAIDNFKKEADKSTADDPLTFVCTGPMESAWRMLNVVDMDKRKFITMISHSNANNTHNDTPQMKNTWNTMKALPGGYKFIDISNQNKNLGEGGNFDAMKSMPQPWPWVHSRFYQKPGDISDVGMIWYLLTGNENASPKDFVERFKNPIPNNVTQISENPNFARYLVGEIHPTLTGSTLSMNLPVGHLVNEVSLVDIHGRKMANLVVSAGENHVAIGTEGMPHGLYVLQASESGRTVLSRKIVVR